MNEISSDILERASEGDIGAFEQVYKATNSFVYNVALRITRNHADAQEVTQDVFMKLHRNLKNFQFRSTLRTWVYRIAVNTAINQYRKTMKESKKRVDYDDVIATFPSQSSSSAGALQSDNESRLNSLLGILNPEQKTCLILREIEGLSYKDISEALKTPVNTVRSRLKRAREALLAHARKEVVKNEV